MRASGLAASSALTCLALLAGASLGGCARSSGSASGDAGGDRPVPVSVAPLRYARIAVPLQLSGSLAAVKSVNVGAMTAGRVVAINVRVGDAVRAGDVIAQIDASAPAADLARARAGESAAAASESASRSTFAAANSAIASAAAQLEVARSRERLSSTTAARMERLFAQGAVSRQQLDEAQSDAAAGRASVAQAQAGLDGARHNLAAAQAQSSAAADTVAGARAEVAAAGVPLRDATVTAPFAGIVVANFVETGAVVAPGSPIAALQDARDLEIDLAVPDDALAGLAPGRRLSVRVDAIGGAPLGGRVRAIVPSQNPALRSATVKVAVPARSGLEPGMFARVTVPGAAHFGWVAPQAALVTRAGQSGVFALRDGIASFVPVSSGTVQAATVELLGIDGRGTNVITGGLQRVDDGTRVAVR